MEDHSNPEPVKKATKKKYQKTWGKHQSDKISLNLVDGFSATINTLKAFKIIQRTDHDAIGGIKNQEWLDFWHSSIKKDLWQPTAS